MGMGGYPLGSTLCGMDGQVSTGYVRATPPAALAFDGITKDFVLDESGRYVAVHPTDAKMFMVCRTLAGSIKSAPNTGHGLGALKFLDRRTIQREVDDQIRLATKSMTELGEVRLLGNVVETNRFGRLSIVVNYVNLLTSKRTSARADL